MVQNGQNDHFGQNDLILNRILVFARPKWTKMVHFGLKRSILVHLGPPTVLWPLLRSLEKGLADGWVRVRNPSCARPPVGPGEGET